MAFAFARMIKEDNEKEKRKYKPDKKEKIKSFGLEHWKETDNNSSNNNFSKKSKTLQTFGGNKKNDSNIIGYSYTEFKPSSISEFEYKQFNPNKIEEYDVEKGRYSNIRSDDLLHRAYQEHDAFEFKDENDIIARINLDDPYEEQAIQDLIQANVSNFPPIRSFKRKKAQELGLNIKNLTPAEENLIKDEFVNLPNEERQYIYDQVEKYFKKIEKAREDVKKRKEEESAKQIQKIARGIKARNELNRLKKEKSATQIQKIARGMKVRNDLKKEESAKQIQKIVRGRKVRNDLNKLRKNEELLSRRPDIPNEEKIKNLTKAQAVARGKIAMNKTQQMREAKETEDQLIRNVRNRKLGINPIEAEEQNAQAVEATPVEDIQVNPLVREKIIGLMKKEISVDKLVKQSSLKRDILIDVSVFLNKTYNSHIEYKNRTRKAILQQIQTDPNLQNIY